MRKGEISDELGRIRAFAGLDAQRELITYVHDIPSPMSTNYNIDRPGITSDYKLSSTHGTSLNSSLMTDPLRPAPIT